MAGGQILYISDGKINLSPLCKAAWLSLIKVRIIIPDGQAIRQFCRSISWINICPCATWDTEGNVQSHTLYASTPGRAHRPRKGKAHSGPYSEVPKHSENERQLQATRMSLRSIINWLRKVNWRWIIHYDCICLKSKAHGKLNNVSFMKRNRRQL